MAFYELSGHEDGTLPFDDVPETASCYDALLTARSIGVIDAAEDNLFDPGHYISSADAQEIITKTLAYLDRPDAALQAQSGVSPDATRVFVRTMNVPAGEEEKSVEYFLHGGIGYVKICDFVNINGFDIFWEESTNTVCIVRAPGEQDVGVSDAPTTLGE